MPLVFIEGANGEYDADGDRLIEISNLEQLNAVRYDLSDGNGRPDDSDDARAYRAAFPTSAGESVCDRACRGYELTSSLDFNSPDSYSAGAVDPEWNGGDGWLPINDNSSGLNAEFEGNGHTISNLYIHRQDTNSVGLFARVGGSGIIRNAGVVNAEMEGLGDSGILAGSNSGTITASYATGSVSGRDTYVGGLVGRQQQRRRHHRQLRHRQRKRRHLCRRAGWGQQRRRHHRQLRHRQRKRQGQRCRRAGWGQQRRHHRQLRHRQRKRHRRCRRAGGGKTAAPSPPATPPAA